MMIVDLHTHIFPPGIINQREEYLNRDSWFGHLYANPKAKLATAEDLIKSMDEAGVDVSVTFGFAWRDSSLCRDHNDYVIDAVRRYSGRLTGFCVINPADGELAIEEANRCFSSGLRGIGELMPDGQGYSVEDASIIKPMMDLLAARQMPLLVHVSEPVGHEYMGKGHNTPDRVLSLITRYPQNSIVLAHWGGGLPFYELMPEVRDACANVYYDTAASPYLYDDRIFSLASSLVPDRILWGTDFPLISQRRFRNRLESSELSPETLNNILGQNAVRLLKLSQASLPSSRKIHDINNDHTDG